MYFRRDSYRLKFDNPVRIMVLLLRASFRVMLASTMLEVGNYPNDTGLTPLSLFNRLVLEQGTSDASLGRS
jgi:hypothetical protein